MKSQAKSLDQQLKSYVRPRVGVTVRVGNGRDKPVERIDQFLRDRIAAVIGDQLWKRHERFHQQEKRSKSTTIFYHVQNPNACGWSHPFTSVHCTLNVDNWPARIPVAADDGRDDVPTLARRSNHLLRHQCRSRIKTVDQSHYLNEYILLIAR